MRGFAMTLGRPDCLCFQLKVVIGVASPDSEKPRRPVSSAGNTESLVFPVSSATQECTVAVKSLYPKPVLAWQNSWCATTAQSDWRYGQVGLVHHRTRVWVGPMRQITSVALAAEL